MFGPDWDAACPGCSSGIDEIADGMLAHLRARDTAFVLVSRAPLDKLEKYRAVTGLDDPLVLLVRQRLQLRLPGHPGPDRQQLVYNYREEPDMVADDPSAEVPGLSCFLRDGNQVFHTYSTWARGTDTVGSAYSLLDLTALGRQEDWEEPKGRAPRLHGADPTFTD